MGRKKGICTLCGKGRTLTFEHVPPQGGLNVKGVVMHTLEDWLQVESLDAPLPNGTPQPDGTGLLALCKPCNEFLGANYVPAHTALVRGGLDILRRIATRLDEIDRRLETTILSIRLDSIDRLACAKQIVSMMLVTSGRSVATKNADLVQFVRDPKAIGLASRFKLSLAIVSGPAARTTGLFARGTFGQAGYATAAEVVYPPFAYVLTFNGTAPGPVGEITSWFEAPFGNPGPINLDLIVGFTHTALAGDLRTRGQLEAITKEKIEAE